MTTDPLLRASTGGMSFTALDISYRPGDNTLPGGLVVPGDFIPHKSNGLKQTVQRVKESVAGNSQFADAVNVPTILEAAGDIQLMLNTGLGLPLWEGLLGAKAAVTAVAPIQSTGAAVTANNVTTIPAVGAWTPGARVDINVSSAGVAGANTECTVVLPASTGTSLVVPALDINASAITGIYVTQPGTTTKVAHSLLPAGFLKDMARLYVERNLGGEWARGYNGVLVEKADVKFTATTIDLQMGLYGTQRARNLNADGSAPAVAAFTPYNPDPTKLDLYINHPMTALNAYFATAGDPLGTGTGSVGAAVGILDASLSYDNALIKKTVLGRKVMQAWPGDHRKLEVNWTEIDTAHFPWLMEEYILNNKQAPFIAYAVANSGSDTNPVFHFFSFYCPNVTFEESGEDDKVGDLVQNQQKATGLVRRELAQDLLQVFYSA